MTKTIFDKVKELGIEYDKHESDLYIPMTPITTKLVKEYEHKENVTKFISNSDGLVWYDIPFAFDDFWKNKRVR